MAIGTTLRVAGFVAALLGSVLVAARADECEEMARVVKSLVDQLDPAAKGGDNGARLCASFAEGLGLIKSMRIVTDECLDEGDERTRVLAGLDRSIRNLQNQVDKNCE
jgi:hypothetical protein